MIDNTRRLRRFLLLPSILVLGLTWSLASSEAWADVLGRLRFSVKDAADEKPIKGAKILLKDSVGVRPDIALTTDERGQGLSPNLETRVWKVTTESNKYQPDEKQVTVIADTTTEIEILLEPLNANPSKENVIRIRGAKELVRKNQTDAVTRRDQSFIKTYPLNTGNPQSLLKILRSSPGFAEDSTNQVHPRGEHSSTAIYINGFYLPGALQGRTGQIITPDTLQNLDILTGAYAPEYGGETAAILNLTLRSGPITPVRDLAAQYGSYDTLYGALTLGGQAGGAIGPPDKDGRVARRFGYLLNVSGRRTDNALEPPQPDDQTAHNHGESESYFGNFDYQAGARDHFTLTLNSTPAFTQIANRAGLPAKYASVGQGFGYTGTLSAADAAAAGIVSQEAAGQDIYQRDSNEFGVLSWRHSFSGNLTGLLSYGAVHSGLDIRNSNPAVNLLALPANSSIEFNPTLLRNSHHNQIQGSLTYSAGNHTVKGGLLADDQEGDETYQLIPASQLALNALAVTAPNLAPAGTVQMDANGMPVLDSLGNPVYLLDPNNPTAPTLHVHRSGFYRAGYLQDTWNASRRFTANYGVRLDWYKAGQNLGQSTVDQVIVSPRVNLSYLLAPRTVGRLAYNHLFIQPPLAQGAILGAATLPETLDQYDASVERQIAPGQVLKIAYYYKEMRNQIDTGLLIPGTQIGAFAALNFEKGHVRGLEVSYDLTPRNEVGLGAYFTYTHSLTKPTGVDSLGGPAPIYSDHDQLNTFNLGLAYTWRSQASIGINIYYGSGLGSSVVFPTDANNNGKRQPRSEVNLALTTGHNLFGKDRGGLNLDIENLFDDRTIVNFNSGFSGTRFEQGRRILFTIFGSL